MWAQQDSIRLQLLGMTLTSNNAVPRVICAVKPAAQPLVQLALRSCTLQAVAWGQGSELTALTRLELTSCTGTRRHKMGAALDSALQHMGSLRDLLCTRCNFSSGLPESLGSLPAIRLLRLSSAGLSALPPLACVPGGSACLHVIGVR